MSNKMAISFKMFFNDVNSQLVTLRFIYGPVLRIDPHPSVDLLLVCQTLGNNIGDIIRWRVCFRTR